MPTKSPKAFQFKFILGLLFPLALISSGCSLSTSLSSLLSQAPAPIQLVSSPTINSGNQNAVTIGGSCTNGVTSFSITSPPPTQIVNCVNGSWSATVDVSGSPDGNVPIITDLTDVRTGQPVIVQVAKDTQPPTVSGFIANNAITLTKLATIPYVATGTDIDEVYVTESATCASGGSWKPSSDDFSLSSYENTKSLYAKARDAAGNESACASVGAITLDQTPPVITGLSDDFTVKASKSWSWGCTEANGPCEYRSTISTLNTQLPLGAYSSTTTASQSSVDGIYYLAVQARDAAGNESTVARVQASLSSSLPSLSIENGANFHTSSNVTLYLTNIGSFDQVELSNAASCASPTTLTPAGTLAWSLTAGEGTRSVSYRFRNTATSEVTECLDDSISIDSVLPTATLSSAFPVNTKSAITVSVSFSEAVTGLSLTDFNFTNAVASSLAGSGASYSFTLTPSSQGAFSVELPANTANDTAGNLNTASNTLNYTYDSVAPTVTLTTAHSPYHNSSPLTFTATFNESITGFTNADLTVINGSATVSGSGPYTVTVTPAAAGDVSVTVNAGAATDAATNASTASNTLTIYYDNINPTVPTVTNSNIGTSSSSSPLISWSGASDAESGILKYEVAVGTSSGASDIVAWTNVGTSTSHTFTSLSLTGGTLYYPSVRVVDNANNTSAVANGIVFRYFVPPTITSVSPASGPIAGGTSITITGTQFYATMSVTIDGNACTSVSVTSTTSMTCATPAGTTGAKDIVVTNPASQSVTSTGGFSYVDGWLTISSNSILTRTSLGFQTTIADKIVFWGGQESGVQSNTGFIVNANDGSWTATSMLNAPSARKHSLINYNQNSLLVAGGTDSAGTVLSSAFLFDPISNIWTPIANIPCPNPTITSSNSNYSNYSFFIVSMFFAIDSNYSCRYDSSTNTWQNANTITIPGGPSVGSDDQGNMFIFGGYENIASTTYYRSSFYYNITTNTWITTSSTGAPSVRASSHIIFLNGEFFVLGGTKGGTSYRDGYAYNVSLNTWRTISVANTPNDLDIHLQKVFVRNNKIWICNSSGCKTYNSVSNDWESGITFPWGANTSITVGKNHIVGQRYSGSTPLNEFSSFSFTNNIWSTVSTTNAPTLRSFGGLYILDNYLVILGGYDAGYNIINGGGTIRLAP